MPMLKARLELWYRAGVETRTGDMATHGVHLGKFGRHVDGMGLSEHEAIRRASLKAPLTIVDVCSGCGLRTSMPSGNRFCQATCRWALMMLLRLPRPWARPCLKLSATLAYFLSTTAWL